MRNTLHAGATLPELLILLSLTTVLGGMTVSVSSGVRDALAVRAARDAAAVEFARARALAQLNGSARLHIDAASGVIRIETPVGAAADTLAAAPITAQFRVSIEVDGSDRFEFDALGLGRLASRTIRFRRNTAEARLTLSTYGRPRRW